jgi:ubiquinone/menaquinone biosynthesis C-methylase UbiE
MPNDYLWRHLQDLPYFRALLRAVEAKFYEDIPLPEPILDLGCGDGHFASAMPNHAPFIGLDPWWGPLVESKGRAAYAGVTQAGGAAIPFPAAHFSTVVSNSVLEHIPDLDPVLAEVERVLKPGGKFVFCVPSDHFLEFLSVSRGLRRIGLNGLASSYEAFFNRISRHHHCDDPATWQARLEQAGLRLARHWYYFSQGALATLEWGHYFGAPSVLTKKLFGRWIVAPTRANLWLTDRLVRRYYDEPLPPQGAYLFFIAEKTSG